MASIYELSDQLEFLLNLLRDPEVDEQVVLDTLESVGYEFETKADGYAKVMYELAADADVIGQEEQRLALKKRTINNNIERMKKVLEASMRKVGKTKFKTALFSFSIQKNPPSVEIVGVVPHDFVVLQEPKINKKALIAYIKEHGDTEYAKLSQTESLRIR